MKKFSIAIIAIAITILNITGCSQNIKENIWKDAIQYSWDLIVAGIWPDESFESTVATGILVIKKTFEDHSDHVFLPENTWNNINDIKKYMLPWNHVNFAGTVKKLDAAAGNHYYEVIQIKELKLIWTPNQPEIENLIQRYSYCKKDTDCTGIYGKCPLWCHIAINIKLESTVKNIIDNFWENQDSKCTYKCMEISKVFCNTSNICEAK